MYSKMSNKYQKNVDEILFKCYLNTKINLRLEIPLK